MSSKRLFWLSTLYLLATSLLLLSGVFCLLLFFFPDVRFSLADSLNENRMGIAIFGSSLFVASVGLFAAYLYLAKERFVQVKLDGMGLGKDLIEKTVREFWQDRFEDVPSVAVDRPDQIEILTSLKENQLSVVESNLPKYLEDKMGYAPKIVLSLCKNS